MLYILVMPTDTMKVVERINRIRRRYHDPTLLSVMASEMGIDYETLRIALLRNQPGGTLATHYALVAWLKDHEDTFPL